MSYCQDHLKAATQIADKFQLRGALQIGTGTLLKEKINFPNPIMHLLVSAWKVGGLDCCTFFRLCVGVVRQLLTNLPDLGPVAG